MKKKPKKLSAKIVDNNEGGEIVENLADENVFEEN
jgi:hypothetical protein